MIRFGLRLIAVMLVACIIVIVLALVIGNVLPPEDELLVGSVIRGNDTDIYRMAFNRHVVVAMTRNTDYDDSDATWSPDGEQIAFMSTRSGPNAIYVMDAQGRSVRRISAGKQLGDFFPIWSPDGQQIVYVNYYPTNSRVLLYDMRDGITRLLLDDAVYNQFPSWSPDGRNIAFISSRYPPNNELMILDVSDGSMRRITDNTMTESITLWSPDGRYILFNTGTTPRFNLWDVFEERLVSLDEPQSFIGLSLDWSPDSRYLIYANFISETRSGIFHMDVMNCIQQPDNCTPELLISTAERYFNPRWRPHQP